MLGERDIIKIITSRLSKYKGKSISRLYDDVDLVRLGDLSVALKCDMLVQSTDVPKQMRLWQVARKSIVACVSDMASKGIKPLYALISLALPSSISKKDVYSLAYGFKRAEKEFGIKIVGGDTNEGKELVIDCCMIGLCSKCKDGNNNNSSSYVKRYGAKHGDAIIVSGPFGYTKAGLLLLMHEDRLKASRRFKSIAVNRVLLPEPRLKFGLALARYATSSMDSSDGLALTLHTMSRLSRKRFIIERLPTTKDVIRFAVDNMLDLKDLVLHAGEEYEIVATVRADMLDKVLRLARDNGCNAIVIGKVEYGSGVFLKEGDKLVEIEERGWEHLKER